MAGRAASQPFYSALTNEQASCAWRHVSWVSKMDTKIRVGFKNCWISFKRRVPHCVTGFNTLFPKSDFQTCRDVA